MFRKYLNNLIQKNKVHRTAFTGDNVRLLGCNTIAAHAYLKGDIKLGKYTSIGRFCVLHGSIEIGRYTQFGPNVQIFSKNHSLNHITPFVGRGLFHKKLKRNHVNQKITIGHSVWIGANVVVLSGVRIGNNCVIGAGSVVTKDIPDYAIAFGNPAVIHKMKFTHEQRKHLDKAEWWLKDATDLQNYQDDFTSEINESLQIFRDLDHEA